MSLTDDIDLTFPSGALSLEGTLKVPQTGPGPAALLISGSGPIDRDSNSEQLSINVMSELASYLAVSGIASLRYDKRGVGNSDGDYLAAGFLDNIADARAALEALRSRPEVDAESVFVVGHSEGAIIASDMSSNSELAGVVLLAGTTQNGRDLLTWQTRQVASSLPKHVQWFSKLLRRDLERNQSRKLARIEATSEDVVRIRRMTLNAKWFREFMAYEPMNQLQRAQVPVLAITGAKDLQVNPNDISLIGQIVPTPFAGHVVDDLTHLLRTETGPPTLRTYKEQARQAVDHRVALIVTDWMRVSSPGFQAQFGPGHLGP